MITLFKNILIILFLLIIIVGVTQFSGPLKTTLMEHIPGGSVKGASTDRAQEISHKVDEDINNQLDSTKKQALNIKVSDVINGFSRLQKIPNDIKASEGYIQEQINNLLKKKK